jgi:Putative lumazine-binding
MALAALMSGCLGGEEDPRPASGPPREIAQVVERLERATAQRDFSTLCDDLFTEAARERAGGEDCERLTRSAAEGIARPRITVKAIELKGERALVEVTTRATGQAEVADTLELRREGGEWRVEALGG